MTALLNTCATSGSPFQYLHLHRITTGTCNRDDRVRMWHTVAMAFVLQV